MQKTIEMSAITSLLIQLDATSNQTEKDKISDEVVEQVMLLTKSTSEAKALFQSEKDLITARGGDVKEYLAHDDVSLKEVLEAYYRGTIDKNDYRRLSKSYTISEMMLMVGTFTQLLEARNNGLEAARKASRQITIRRWADKFSKEKAVEDFQLLEEMVRGAKISEERMISYLNDQITVTMKAILEAMGSNFAMASKKQIEGIFDSAYALCTASKPLATTFERRREEFPAIYSDVALLDGCGEHSPKLYRVMDTGEFQSYEGKGTK